ncbi:MULTISPECIES: hypothetical protein [Streptomyces]|jgi:hypothetical protein|uniref:Uncharacterized protein n=1 Tax=Streptomyces sp. 900129855 TaxID=3155129 RepID=A0ABV2ZGC6_9ACTN
MKHVTKTLVAVIAATGAFLLSAGPAVATIAQPRLVTWQEVGDTDENWKCGPVVDHPAGDGIRFRACIIKNASNDAQAVLVLVNNSGSRIQINGEANTTIRINWNPSARNIGDVNCASSPLNTGFQRGCFSQTKPTDQLNGRPLRVTIRLNVDGYVKVIKYTRND